MLVPGLGSGPWLAEALGLHLGPQSPVLSPSPQALTRESASQSKTLKDVSLLNIVKAAVKTCLLNFFVFPEQ